jgi:hypothetical protein
MKEHWKLIKSFDARMWRGVVEFIFVLMIFPFWYVVESMTKEREDLA